MKTALLVSVSLLICPGAVQADEPDRVSRSGSSRWEGRSADEVVAAWGEPTKTKKDGRGGKVLVYRLRFAGDETVGEGMIHWSDVGIGPPDETSDRQHAKYSLAGGLSIVGGQEVIATQKVKFYVNREGIVYREESGRFKWKTKPWSPGPSEPGPDPSGPECW